MTAPLYTPNSYAATGVAGSYAYGFRILDQTHLMATLNGVALVLGADYTVDGVGASAGGNLIPLTPAAIVGTLVLSRNVPYTRTTDFQDDFRPLTFNNDQDLQTMQAQQLADAAVRSMSLPVGTTGVNVTLPLPGAGKFFRYNAGGTAIEVVDLAATLGSAVASAFGLTLMQAASAPAGTDVLFGAVISPAQIVANTDNYAPAGLSTASMLRINTDAARNLTGISASADRRLLSLHNIGAFAITLKDNVTSAAANQFQLNGDYTLGPDASVLLQYDVTSAKWRLFGQQSQAAPVYPAVCSSRALKCSVTAASAQATWTADGVVVATALNGAALLLPSFNKQCDLGTVGAGGMDTGAAPASGFVSIYAIAKADGTQSILACNVATSSGSIYGGANMPAGYTYSALISTWPTTAGSLFVIGYQEDRLVSIVSAQALNNGTAAAYTSISLSTLVPANAKRVRGNFGVSVAGGSGVIALASASANAIAECVAGGGAATAGIESIATGGAGYELPLITAQTIYYKMESAARDGQVWVSGYTI